MSPFSNQTTRDAILNAALSTFLAGGFGATSMDLIATEAGVARRTVFNQFETKEALFKSAVELLWGRLPQGEIVTDESFLSDPRMGLSKIAHVTVAFWSEPQSVSLLKLVIAEGDRFPFLLKTYLDRGKLPAMNHLTGYLDAITARGHVEIENTWLAARQFIGLLKEPLVWSQVIGMTGTPSKAFQAEVEQEAVETFLCRYPIARRS